MLGLDHHLARNRLRLRECLANAEDRRVRHLEARQPFGQFGDRVLPRVAGNHLVDQRALVAPLLDAVEARIVDRFRHVDRLADATPERIGDRKSTRLNSSHYYASRMPSYALKKKSQQ